MAGRTYPKLADFGLARYADVEGFCTTACGTPLFCAPEINLRGGRPPPGRGGRRGYEGTKADIWSLGVILYFMVSASGIPVGVAAAAVGWRGGLGGRRRQLQSRDSISRFR